DLLAGDSSAVLVHVELDAGLDLLADGCEAAGERQHHANFDVLGQDAGGRHCARRQGNRDDTQHEFPLLGMSLRQSISEVAAGHALSLWWPLYRVLDMLGNVDFVRSNCDSIGALLASAGWFLDSGWGTLTSVIIGVTMLGYSINRGLRSEANSLAMSQDDVL